MKDKKSRGRTVEKNANDPENQPSTSGVQESEVNNVEDERLNESLQSYAEAFNLSALNVKNIIFVSRF